MARTLTDEERQLANEQPVANPFIGWTTIDEVAKIINRDHSTVRGWADKGWIISFYVGRKVRLVRIDEVKAFNERAVRKPKRRARIPKSPQ